MIWKVVFPRGTDVKGTAVEETRPSVYIGHGKRCHEWIEHFELWTDSEWSKDFAVGRSQRAVSIAQLAALDPLNCLNMWIIYGHI